ncbi:hypothetical protein HZB60_12280 [candidate division KSB1 bacterium]|nr:hypothetical protein [candidate division KSB1 bacterium]
MKHILTTTICAGLLMATSVVPLWAEDHPSHAAPAAEATVQTAASTTSQAAAYPLEKCIVSGESLGEMGKPVVKTYDGREVKFCCNNCVKTFEKDQTKWMTKLDDAIISVQSKTYPIETCVVSGEKLGGMGDPVNYMYKNQLVKFCCKSCIGSFEKDPEKYLKMLSPAPAADAPAAPDAK